MKQLEIATFSYYAVRELKLVECCVLDVNWLPCSFMMQATKLHMLMLNCWLDLWRIVYICLLKNFGSCCMIMIDLVEVYATAGLWFG